MHHGVRVRVFFRRLSEHHSRNDSRNDSSSSTSWSHDVHVFSHIRTHYFSEGSVQQHPPPYEYSFRKRVLVRPVMKRLFFSWKTKEKKARFARAPHDNIVFTGPTIYSKYISSCVFTGPTIRTSCSFFGYFFLNLAFTRACWRSFGITSYLPQPQIVFASSSIDEHGSQLSTAGIRQLNSSSTHQPTAALQIDQSLYHNWKLCRQPGFTACSARESTTTEITGPKMIGLSYRYSFNTVAVATTSDR